MELSDSATFAQRSFAFGPFVLYPERQLLLHGEVPVRIGGRALDILTTLVERPGDVVSKRELLARVWPDTIVERSNLKVNMAALRRALGEGAGTSRYIATVVGEGYRFVAPVEPSLGPLPRSRRSLRSHNLPTQATRIFGRAGTIEGVQRDLDESRLVSIVGAGGIGKTTVALAVAEQVVESFRDGVWLIELALLKDPLLVPNAIAAALGVVAYLPSVLAAVCEHLRNRELLLIFDSCEHLIDGAGACASRFLAEAAGVKILVTSREPLLVNGERVRRLPGLATPPQSGLLNAEQALAFPAVQLFVDRATDRDESFALGDVEAPAVAEICRRLDGLALAIELAATRLDAFGVGGLLKQLDERIGLVVERRAGPERHRTLTATLDWSYGLLSPDEAELLCAVSVFAGVFDIAGASAVANVPRADAASTLAQLAEKSLLAADIDADSTAYRLPETTRAYCLEGLQARGMDQVVRGRHAEHVCALLERAASEWAQRPASEWGGAYGRLLDDLRGALAHARRDGALRIRLTVAGILLWNHFALIAECEAHVSQAVAELDAAGLVGTALEMRLQLWLGDASAFTRGPLSEAMHALRRARDIAARLGDTDCHIRCLRLIGVCELFRGESEAALRTLNTFVATAAAQLPAAALEAENALGIAELLVGRLQSARARLERHREHEPRASQDVPSSRYHVRYMSDGIVDVGNVLSHVEWLTGSPDAALRTAMQAVEQARQTKHHLSLATTLSWVCPVFFWTGRHELCALHAAMLDDESTRHGFAVRRPVAMFYRAALACARSGAGPDAIDGLERAIEALHATRHLVRLPFYLGVQAEVLVRHGRLGDAKNALRAALDRSTAKNELWCRPELLRIKGSLLFAEGKPAKAEAVLRESLTLAERLGALSWRLRTASDLMRLSRAQANETDAHELLRSVFNEFSEGLTTRDLKVAAELLTQTG